MYNKSKNGFTLAEVLITLVIIGVVAALTIPTAISKYKEQELKSQFAKAYSAISQAINKTNKIDFYGYARCYYDSSHDQNAVYYTTVDCHSFYTTLTKNLGTQKICMNNSLADGCVPVYQNYNSACGAYSEDSINNTNTSYVLAGGQILIMYGYYGAPLFLLDINGHKGPNVPGKDLFGFMLKKDDYNVYLDGNEGCFEPVSGGRTTNEMIRYSLSGTK